MLDSGSLFVTDEFGNEKRMEILFTFEDEENHKKYVVFFDPESDAEEEVFASCYDDEGNLIPIETEKEWEMVEEVIGAFQEQDDDEKEA